MKITVLTNPEPSVELKMMMAEAEFWGSSGVTSNDHVMYDVTDDRISKEQLNALLASPSVELDQASVYIEMPFSALDNLVTVSMADSKYIDDEGEEYRREWQEYAPFFAVNNAGDSVLVRCVKVKRGSTCGNGTSASDLAEWLEVFGSVIGAQEYNELMASPEWLVEGQE